MRLRPNLYWRELVQNRFWRFREAAQAPTAEEFLRFADKSYRETKLQLAQVSDPQERQGLGLALYILAAALLTYGRLEVLEDLLRHAPPPRARARILLESVDELLPAEAALNAQADPDTALAWIAAHRERLRWHEELGRFELANVPTNKNQN